MPWASSNPKPSPVISLTLTNSSTIQNSGAAGVCAYISTTGALYQSKVIAKLWLLIVVNALSGQLWEGKNKRLLYLKLVLTA